MTPFPMASTQQRGFPSILIFIPRSLAWCDPQLGNGEARDVERTNTGEWVCVRSSAESPQNLAWRAVLSLSLHMHWNSLKNKWKSKRVIKAIKIIWNISKHILPQTLTRATVFLLLGLSKVEQEWNFLTVPMLLMFFGTFLFRCVMKMTVCQSSKLPGTS